MSVLLRLPHCLDYCSFVVSLCVFLYCGKMYKTKFTILTVFNYACIKFWNGLVWVFYFVPFSRWLWLFWVTCISIWILGPACQFLQKKAIDILNEIAVNLYITLGILISWVSQSMNCLSTYSCLWFRSTIFCSFCEEDLHFLC